MPKLYLSPSKIDDYQKCPRLYQLRYVDRIPVPDPSALILGSAVHRGVEWIHLGKPLEEAVREAEERAAARTAKDYDRQLSPERIRDMAGKMVRTYHAHAKPLALCGVEEWFEIVGEHVILRGVIDAPVDMHQTILEIKTGKRAWSQAQADFSFQPTVYAFNSRFTHHVKTPVKTIYRVLIKPIFRKPVEMDLKRPDGKVLASQTRKWNDLSKTFKEFEPERNLGVEVGLEDDFSKLDQKTALAALNRGISVVNRVDRGRLQEIETVRTEEHFEHMKSTINGVARGIQQGVFPRHITPLCAYCAHKRICLGDGYGPSASENGDDVGPNGGDDE